MSVSCFVLNSTTEEENKFSFPIATEKVYSNCWFKFAEDNELYWLKFFLYGLDVTKNDFSEIINELLLFENFLQTTSDIVFLNNKENISERINLFLLKLDEAKGFNDDVVFFIG